MRNADCNATRLDPKRPPLPAVRYWLFALVLPAAASHADIYACAGKSGMTVYQNFTCEVDSLGALPSTAPVRVPSAATNPRPVPGMPAGFVRAAGIRTPASSGEPQTGMSAAEVKARWGDPESVYGDELVDGRVEIWNYGASRAVHFDPGGRVVLVKH